MVGFGLPGFLIRLELQAVVDHLEYCHHNPRVEQQSKI